ncbi:MAG: hypothetical protein H6737_08455 [Alphaproteobacteria bacterium]|nr:hypothetical protein [Alphaproteobacteria bacterium]
MLFLLPLALANPDDPEKLKAIALQLDEVDGRVAEALMLYGLVGAEPEAAAKVEPLREALRADASEARKLNLAVGAIKGRLAAGPKEEQEHLPEAEALIERIKSQNRTRFTAISLLDAAAAFPRIEGGDATGFATVNNSLYGVAQSPPEGADIDLWMKRPIALAVEKERWDMVFSWATYCAKACKDPSEAKAALEKVPARHAKDARWLTL